MTAPWDRAKETSTGALRWRLALDSIGTEFVSDEEMAVARVLATDVERIPGLNTDGLRLSEKGSLIRAKWEPSGFKVRVVAEYGHDLFHTDPSAVTYLGEDVVTDADVTFEALGTDAFPSSGVIYMGTETMAYSAKTIDSFGGLTRGLWSVSGEAAQYHYRSSEYISDDRLMIPEITDRPVVFEGRRAYLYVYAPGDDPQGDGTRVWTGIVSTDPVLDGDFWSFTVDPLSRLFAYTLSADLGEEFGIDGIYYPNGAPLLIEVVEYDTTARPVADVDTVLNSVAFRLLGRFASQREFLDCVNYLLGNLTTSFSGWTTSVVAERSGNTWSLFYTTPATGEKWISLTIRSATDGWGPAPGSLNTGLALVGGTAPWTGQGGPTDVAASSTYRALFEQTEGSMDPEAPGGGGTVPRTAWRWSGWRPGADEAAYSYESTDGTFAGANLTAGELDFPDDRLYLNVPVTVQPERTVLHVDWERLDPGPMQSFGPTPRPQGFSGLMPITAVDASEGWVETDAPPFEGGDGVVRPVIGQLIATSESRPVIRATRGYSDDGGGSLADFIQRLLDDRAEYLNLGITPDLRPDDFASGWDDEIREVAALASLLRMRGYVAGDAIELDQMLEHELRLGGWYAHFDMEGRVNFREIRAPSDVETVAAVIDLDQLVVDGFWFKYEPAQLGIFNEVAHSTGYDPIEDEHAGPPWNFRWMRGFSRVPGGRTLEVAPKSVDPPRLPEHDGQRTIGAHKVLATFGERYAILTVQVLFEHFDLVRGDVVEVSWSKLPSADGSLGATVTARVVGRSWAPHDDGAGTLTLLISRVRYGGYAPGAKIGSITGTSGGTGPFVVGMTLADYFPAGTDLTDFIEIGDELELFRWGHRVADRQVATVTDIPTSSSLEITTAGAWTHSGYTWAWGALKATEYSSDQNLAAFAFEANSSSRIEYSDRNVTRMVFAP